MPEIILFVGLAITQMTLGLTNRGVRGEKRPIPNEASGGASEEESKTKLKPHLSISPFSTLISQVSSLAAILISAFAFALIVFVSYRAGTEQSIRTPWPLLPSWILPLIGMQWIFTISSIWKLKNRWITFFQSTFAIGSTTVIAPLVYRIGYGFDGFLHVAGETILLKTGTLLPHPMYYMGQYLLTTWISRIGEINIAVIDRWLVPTSAAILLPLALLTCITREHKITRFAALILIPLAPFVTTTPHGFAVILACTSVLLAIGVTEFAIHPALSVIIAIWCSLTHPLIGLPILGATIALAVYKHGSIPRTILSILIAIGGSLAVPVMFGLASAIGSSGGVNFQLSSLSSIDKWKEISSAWIPWVQNRYAIWAESSVWIEKLLPWFVIILAMIERIRRMIKKEASPPWLAAAIGTTVAAIILKIAGDFGFLIDYERGNYADRLWLVAWILLLPLAIPILGRALYRLRDGHNASMAGALVSIGILAAGMSYAALPRHDAVTPSRGWSVGLADIEAVKLIDEDSNGEAYTVLANQSVSAAAVRTYGFKRYNGDVFFYPIPTGGSLYEIFLKASYEDPSLKTMTEAAKLGDSHLVYLVVNDYWWKSAELSELAKKDASRMFEIQNGKVKVFKYEVR